MRSRMSSLMLGGILVTAACGGGDTPPREGQTGPGSERTAKTAALETGADLLQAKAPVENIAMYLNGFHVSKHDPAMQMEAHHYCNQANEDLAQCVLFDGNTGDARLMGIEYIISEKLYGTLPADEKAYRDGEADPAMIQARDARMDLDTIRARQDRKDLVPLARPQGGVDAMAAFFPGAAAIPGVADNGDAAARPVPTFGMETRTPRPAGR